MGSLELHIGREWKASWLSNKNLGEIKNNQSYFPIKMKTSSIEPIDNIMPNEEKEDIYQSQSYRNVLLNTHLKTDWPEQQFMLKSLKLHTGQFSGPAYKG